MVSGIGSLTDYSVVGSLNILPGADGSNSVNSADDTFLDILSDTESDDKDTETVDMDRFQALGVITDKEKCDQNKLLRLLADLENIFRGQEVEKEEVIRIIGEYLPNFSHIETGRSLDSKM